MAEQKPSFLVFDCESSGIDVFNDRIVQLVIGIANRQGDILKHWEWLINPGVPMPEEAAKVHGFTTEYLQEHGRPPWWPLSEALGVFRRHWTLPWVAYNINYDLSILNAEFERHGIATGWGQIVAENVRLFDPLVVDRAKDKYRKGSRKLMHVAEHYRIGFDPDELHDAKADCELTAKVAAAVRNRFGPVTNEEQATWYKAWADNFREYLIKKGEEPEGLDGQWPLRVKE